MQLAGQARQLGGVGRVGGVTTFRQALCERVGVAAGADRTAIARIEGIEVSTAGEALDAGARGALVRVKNSTSGQTVRMRVIAPGTVEPVDMPRAGSAVNR